MAGVNFATISYPGVIAWESVSITDVSGISPAIAVLTMYPQGDLPDPNGDLVFYYNGSEVVRFRNMHLDAMSYQRGSGGKVVTLRLLDERWTWADASITLRANIRLPSNYVDPNHEWTPQQLASACFDALGVGDYDVSALPNDARPDVDWDHANPAQELAKICDDLGCRIVPQRSTGGWVICVTGEGYDLPDNLPYNDAGNGIDPKETPDFIKIVSAPILYQYAVKLEPIGKELDQSWEVLSTLSYAPTEDATSAYGFAHESLNAFANINPTRARQPDGTLLSEQELALQTILRCWRIADAFPYGKTHPAPVTRLNPNRNNGPAQVPNQASIVVPGFPYPVFRKQIVLSDKLVQSYTDVYGEEHKRPAFIFGSFWGNLAKMGQNYSFGKRIDSQTTRSDQLDLEEQRSFSIAVDQNDSDKTIVTISAPMIRITNPDPPIEQEVIHGAAQLWLMTSVQVRDFNSWQPVRNEYFYQIGNGTNYNFCLEVVKNDIQPWYITTYPVLGLDSTGNDLIPGDTADNYDTVLRQSLYYAQSIAQTFQAVQTSTRTYIGLFEIDMDGAIQQVTYRIGKDGSSTIASRGTEHDFDIPDYWSRRQRDATHGIAEKLQLQQEVLNQRNALKGNFNT